jgi:hypothetical protein
LPRHAACIYERAGARLVSASSRSWYAMWYVKDLIDRAQVAFLLWRLHRRRRAVNA